MKKQTLTTLATLAILAVFSASARAYTNPPVPSSSGVTTETCDVRSSADYDPNGTAVEKTLRHRIDLFNAELDGGPQKCIFGIYFLDPYAIKLKAPLKIRALKHTLDNGLQAGTYISGADTNNQDMGVVINGYDVTNNMNSNCAIMIESGLASIQQIHKLTIIATSKDRAICDYNGVDLMEQTIPETTVRKNCSTDDKAKDCDFKNVTVVVKPGTDTPDGDSDGDGVVNGDDQCPNTPDGEAVNEVGCPDTDGDGIYDNEDDCDTLPGPTKPHPLNGCPDDTGGPDQDGDGIVDEDDFCDLDSTGGACDSSNLADCFPDAGDNVCSGVPVGASVACSEEEDMDNDGLGNRCDTDIDGDTLPNGSDPDPFDKDADNDGDPDNTDPCPLLNGVVLNSLGQCAPEPVNPLESDPDGDGLTTTLETELGTDPNNADTDGDGYKDGVDCFPLDGEKQVCGGASTVVDPDFDNDGICNGAESGTDPVTGDPCTPNALGLGDNCPATPNPDQLDSNGDGIGDACEISSSLDGDGDGLPDDLEENVFHTDPTKADTDGDGLSDSEEVSGPTYQNGAGPLNPDVDEDGICDGPATVSDDAGEICNAGPNGTGDNCPIVPNSDQVDSDENGRGDACDGDMDGDGVADEEDNCPFISNPLQADSNEDGVGDACDPNLEISGIDGGCGCRLDGQSTGRPQDMIPFAALMIPLALFGIVRRRTSEN